MAMQHIPAENPDKPHENYWNLHRNTLFFSALLLVFSINGISISAIGLSPGITFDKDLSSTISMLLLISSVYAMIAYFTEFYKEFVPIFARDNRAPAGTHQAITSNLIEFRTIITLVSESSEKILDGILKLVETVEISTEKLRKFEFADHNQSSAALSELRSIGISDLQKTLLESSRITEVSNKFSSRINTPYVEMYQYHMQHTFGDLKNYLDRRDNLIFNACYGNEFFKTMPNTKDELAKIDREISNLNTRFDRFENANNHLEKTVRPLILAINRSSRFEKFRLYAIHLGAPILLFSVSFSHFCGKYVYKLVDFDVHSISRMLMLQSQ